MSDSIVIEESNGEIIVIEPTVVINQNAGVDQIPADWNQKDNTKPDFIKNKPTIPGAPAWGEIGGDIGNQSDLVEEFAKKMNVAPTVLPNVTNPDDIKTNGKYTFNDAVLFVTETNDFIYQIYLTDEYTMIFRLWDGFEWTEWQQVARQSQVDYDLNLKVDKVAGKGLSTNDYTDTDKAKLGSAVTSSTIAEIVMLTQTAYDALNPKVTTTLYIITGA